MNFRFPVFLDLTGKSCLVAGEGFEVAAKVQALVDASALVTYINPSAEPRIQALAAAGKIAWEQRTYQEADLDGRFLVISDQKANPDVFRAAEARNILCNCVDDPPNCRFSFGSIHRQGELSIAISTNGWAPAVAVRIKEKLQREIGPEYAALMDLLKSARPVISQRFADFDQRRNLWYKIVDSEALQLIRDGNPAAARDLIEHLIEAAPNNTSHSHISGEDGHQ